MLIKKSMDVKCPLCNDAFYRGCELSQHMKWVHKQHKSLFCDICNKKFTHTNHFESHKRKHLRKEKYKPEEIIFDSFSEFTKWKEMTETQTKSRFIKQCGSKKMKDYTSIIYYCHRSGKYIPSGKNKRSLKIQGSVKINSRCPAKMTVKYYENRVLVSFIKTHVGHTMDLNKLALTKKEKDMIAEKIAKKIPLDDILDSFKDSLTEENSHCLNIPKRRDLLNIRKSYNLQNVAEIHNNSNISVEEWIKQIQESSNLIRLYKPQFQMLDNYPQLDINDFLLIIANDTQLKLLSSFGNDCLCINRIDGVDSNDFRLYSILILDELQEAIPCLFLLTNRDDTVAMEVYFNVLLKHLPSPISPKFFMSDVTESFYNAWTSVTAGDKNTHPHQLYSSWHVDQQWRTALSLIDDKEKQVEVYKNLKVIMHEPDISSFNAMVENFMRELYSDMSTQDFAEYLERNFHDSSFWSYCFRLNEGVNTNMSLENMHALLKHVYVQGRRVQRLDKCVKALMQFSRERLYDRFIKINKADASHKLTDVKAKHQKSLSLSYDNIQKVSGTWLVPSSKNSNHCYEVVPANTECSCNLKCDDCGICVHYFRCTCFDATIKWNMCKHIHLIARIMNQEPLQSFTDDTYLVEEIIKPEVVNCGNEIINNGNEVINCSNEVEYDIDAESSHKLTDVKVKHKKSLSLSCDNIQKVSGTWLVPSSKNSNHCYEVVPANTECNCNLKCDECGMCIHYFRCTCFDATIKSNMCKHIHLIARIMNQEPLKSFTDPTYLVEEIMKPEVVNCGNKVINSGNEVINSGNQVINSGNEVINAGNELINSSNEVINSGNEVINSGNEVIYCSNEVEYDIDVESEVIIEQHSENFSTEEFIQRKILLLEKFLGVTNMVENLVELEALEKTVALAEDGILSLKKNK